MLATNDQYIIGMSEFLISYGRHTPYHNTNMVRSYEDAMPQTQTAGNHWSSTENSSNNAWNVNFNSGNTNNNNKYNNFTVRPSVAHESDEWKALRETLQIAYKDCCRGKTSSKQCQEYIPTADEDLDALTTELLERTYKPDTSTCFLVKFPKLREVFAAAFRDRIIHHWLCLRLEPLFERLCRQQGNVTHNCRKGYGTKTAVEEAAKGIKRVTGNYHQEGWIFKGDLVGFFMSIDQYKMCKRLLKFAKTHYHGDFKELLLWLIEVVVMHRPEKNCLLNSSPHDFIYLKSNKSLHRCAPGKGMPIGNLTTQQFANFFMAEFDGFVIKCLRAYKRKHRGFKWSYTRFVDDFIICCNDKKFLLWFIERCAEKLSEMGLTLHKDKRYIQPATYGTMFVGKYIHNGRIYLSNRTLARFREKVYGYTLYLQKPEEEITILELEHIRATINSYLGFCKGCQTYKFRREILREFFLKCEKYFYHDKNWSKIKLRRKYTTICK